MEHRGFTVWFTGLSGSGKSTVARLVADELRRRGLKVELLSGREFRRNISQGLGFAREDRIANVRRIGYVAKLLSRNGVAVITTSISPYREVRDECRREIGDFVEVFIDCPIEVCEARETTGIYARARAGLLEDVSGVTDPYEPPENPEVVCRTDRETPAESAARVLATLERLGYAPPRADGEPPAEEELIKARLRELQGS